MLKAIPEFKETCRCGSPKPHTSIIKADASQFFKAADLDRGLSRIQSLLMRVKHAKGVNAVAIKRQLRVDGYLCTTKKKSNHIVEVISFDRILQGLCVGYHDKFLCLGDQIIFRNQGWPMGGSLSEPGTLVDLQHDVWCAAKIGKFVSAWDEQWGANSAANDCQYTARRRCTPFFKSVL